MKVTIKQPNITQYHFQLEPNDELYRSCMWATINFDHDTYTMTATSDCGNYSYAWYPTQSESFADLMKRINGDYLLSKISDESVFDFEASKEWALKEARTYDSDDDVIHELEHLEDCGEEHFLRMLHDLAGWDYESICIIKHFPHGAKTFAEIFTKYLQPILRGVTV